jgi:SAM-dependent methyltransferase
MALMSGSTCIACASNRLVLRLSVAGGMGADGLIRTTSEFGTALADVVRCETSGHMQHGPRPSETILSEFYADAESDDYVGEEAGQRETARHALERIRRLLRPGGLLCLGLPDAGGLLARLMGRRWWSVLPDPRAVLTRGSMAQLLDANGFDVLEFRTAPKAFTVHSYLSRIGGYSPAVGRALATAADRAGIGQKMWAPDFRDRMSVSARTRP